MILTYTDFILIYYNFISFSLAYYFYFSFYFFSRRYWWYLFKTLPIPAAFQWNNNYYVLYFAFDYFANGHEQIYISYIILLFLHAQFSLAFLVYRFLFSIFLLFSFSILSLIFLAPQHIFYFSFSLLVLTSFSGDFCGCYWLLISFRQKHDCLDILLILSRLSLRNLLTRYRKIIRHSLFPSFISLAFGLIHSFMDLLLLAFSAILHAYWFNEGHLFFAILRTARDYWCNYLRCCFLMGVLHSRISLHFRFYFDCWLLPNVFHSSGHAHTGTHNTSPITRAYIQNDTNAADYLISRYCTCRQIWLIYLVKPYLMPDYYFDTSQSLSFVRELLHTNFKQNYHTIASSKFLKIPHLLHTLLFYFYTSAYLNSILSFSIIYSIFSCFEYIIFIVIFDIITSCYQYQLTYILSLIYISKFQTSCLIITIIGLSFACQISFTFHFILRIFIEWRFPHVCISACITAAALFHFSCFGYIGASRAAPIAVDAFEMVTTYHYLFSLASLLENASSIMILHDFRCYDMISLAFRRYFDFRAISHRRSMPLTFSIFSA